MEKDCRTKKLGCFQYVFFSRFLSIILSTIPASVLYLRKKRKRNGIREMVKCLKQFS